MGLIKKIKYAIFGKTIFDDYRDIPKNKKLTENEKFSKILHLTGNYFNSEHKNYVSLCVCENYYESLYVDGKLQKEVFNNLFKLEDESISNFVLVSLIGATDELKVDFKELSEEEKSLFVDIHSISEMLKIGAELGCDFHSVVKSNKEIYDNLSKKIVDGAIEYSKMKNNNDNFEMIK